MRDCCIIFFIKYPEKGKIKTRLAKDINEDFVLNLYRCFVIDILSVLNKLKFDFKIYFDPPGSLIKIKKWLGENYTFVQQRGSDLGERMKNAFESVFEEDYNKAIIIGSDMPCFSCDFFSDIFDELGDNHTVIGPSPDGGYYLLGFKKDTFLKEVFYDIHWSTENVLSSTMKIFNKYKYKVNILEVMNDIDTFDDLRDFFYKNKNSDFKNSNTMKYILKSKIF